MAIQINLDATNNNVDDLSFGLLRTNPTISTNAKLVVDSDGYLFMDAFIASSELSKNNYRKYPINPETGSYSYDLASYFGSLPNDVKFKVGRAGSDYNIYSDYSNQYEVQYNYGASFNATKVYKEQYRFLAPIWLDKNMPTNFVVYRVDGATYENDIFANNISGQNSRILELLSKSTIVASYDLTETSNIGKYLRTHVNDKAFPVSPISQNFEMDQYTIYRGIDVTKGGFVEKKESLYDELVQHDNLEIFNNQMLTSGFERNGVASANLINIEYLFDDFNANDYDIYRYFGVYVTEKVEGNFDVDRIIDTENRQGIFIDTSSVTTNFNLTGTALTAVDMLPKFSDLRLPSLNWVKSKSGTLYHIRNAELFSENDFLPVSLNKSPENEFIGNTIIGTVQLADFSVNLRDFIKIKINEIPSNGDKLFIAPITELKSTGFDVNKFMIAAENSLSAGQYTENKFSINGTVNDVARALSGCISQSEYGFKVKYIDDTIIVEDYAVGATRKASIFAVNKNNVSNFFEVVDGVNSTTSTTFTGTFTCSGGSTTITVTAAAAGSLKAGQTIISAGAFITSGTTIVQQLTGTPGGIGTYSISSGGLSGGTGLPLITNNTYTDGLPSSYYNDWDIYFPYGGSIKNRAVLVKTENKGNILVGDLVRSGINDNFVKIKQIVQDPISSDLWRIIFEKDVELPASKNINIYQKYKIKYGRFQICDLKDFDFDFYDTSNSNLNELDLEGVISTSHQFYRYDLASGPNFTTEASKYYANLLPVSVPEVVNKRKGVTVLNDEGEINVFNETLSSEYDRLYENNIKETAVLSRVCPNINKFVLKDGFNARMTPYHLSMSESFGVNNLSPSLDGDTRDPQLLNMEHFHITNTPLNILADIDNLYKNKSYLEFGISRKLSLTDLKSTSFNFFDKYMVWNGAFSNYVMLVDIQQTSVPITGSGSSQTGGTLTKYIFNGPLSSVNKTIVAGTGIERAGNNNAYFDDVVNLYAGSNTMFTFGDPVIPAVENGLKIGDIVYRNIDSAGAPIQTFVKNKRQVRYSKFSNGSLNNFASTVFRGLRYVFKNRKESERQIPKEFNLTGEVNGYKFGFVVDYNTNIGSTSKAITCVKNDKFKFICFYINLSLQSAIIRTFNRKVFYEVQSAINTLGEAINTSIDGVLDFANADWTTPKVYIKGLVSPTGKTPKFKSQINTINGQYSYLIFTVGGVQRVLKVETVVGDDAIIVSGYPTAWTPSSNVPIGTGTPWTSPGSIPSTVQQSITYSYYEGGYGALTEILESINAKQISDLINNNPYEIEYVTVQENGTTLNNQFLINVEDGHEVIKLSALSTTVDSAKPKSYKVTSVEVGKNVVEREDKYFTVMKRMNGDYLPKFRDVVFFEEIYPSSICYTLDNAAQPIKTKQTLLYNRYNNTGVVFGSMYGLTGENKFGFIPNYHYHKVNQESADAVLKLSVSSDKLPLYPAIGEIAIGKKDFNILKSKYADDYYTKSILNNGEEPAFGTLNPIEKNSFMSSTIMKVSDAYILSRFNAVKVGSVDELDRFSIKASKDNSIAYYETNDRIYIDVYAKFALLDELIEKGITKKFNKYVAPSKSYGDITTIKDDLVRYVEYNIVPRFIIESVDLYARESKDLETSFVSVQDISDIDQSIYVKQTNYTYQNFTEDRLGFRLIYSKKPGYQYHVIPVIKIIA